MRYYELDANGYVISFGVSENGGEEIDEARYLAIEEAVNAKPTDTETIGHRLRTDLVWEEYPLDPPDPDPDINDAEALAILLGGAE